MNNALLIGLTCGGAFLLAFLLFNPPNRTNLMANRWLGLFAMTFAGAMLEIFLHTLQLNNQYYILLDLAELSRFLSAPTLYLSIRAFTNPDKTFHKKDAWHLVPFVLFFLIQLPHILTGQNLPITDKRLLQVLFWVFRLTLPIQTVIYWFLSFYTLRRHQNSIQQVASFTEWIDLIWLQRFLWVLGLVIVVWLNLVFFKIKLLSDFTPLIYLTSTYFLAYFALRQREIYAFSPAELKQLETLIVPDAPKTEKQKRLSESQVLAVKNRLEHLMVHEKVFLDAELSLPRLAQKMDITIHELSYVINEVYGENFFAFVNKYRIEEAKRLLLSAQLERLNMVGIAYQAGFNSKTTFNTTFKKWVGMSPTAFVNASKTNQDE